MKGRVQKDSRTGDWVVVLELGRHPDGRRNAPWVGRFPKGQKDKAEAFLVEKLKELQEGTYVEPSTITVGEWCERWLRDYAPLRVKDTTLDQYRRKIKNHITADLGTVGLQQLGRPTVQRAVTKWSKEVKASTTRQIATLLKAILKEAVESGLIKRSPAESMSLPRVTRTEMRVLDDVEIRDLLEKLKGNNLYLPALIGVTTGLRRGEILGLKWDAIENSLLTVRQSIAQNNTVHPPKTDRGRRTIALPAAVVAALKEHSRQQKEDRLAAGRNWKDTGYVLTKATGEHWTVNDLSCNWTRTMQRLGINLRFHDLRHTHASQLLKAGYSLNVVAARLGHDPSETLRTYAHLLPGQDESAAQAMDTLLANCLQNAVGAR